MAPSYLVGHQDPPFFTPAQSLRLSFFYTILDQTTSVSPSLWTWSAMFKEISFHTLYLLYFLVDSSFVAHKVWQAIIIWAITIRSYELRMSSHTHTVCIISWLWLKLWQLKVLTMTLNLFVLYNCAMALYSLLPRHLKRLGGGRMLLKRDHILQITSCK